MNNDIRTILYAANLGLAAKRCWTKDRKART